MCSKDVSLENNTFCVYGHSIKDFSVTGQTTQKNNIIQRKSKKLKAYHLHFIIKVYVICSDFTKHIIYTVFSQSSANLVW